MTVFWKTDRMDTNTEIHFLPVDESHTHALFRETKHLRLDGQVCFYRRLFSDAVKPRGCLSWPLWPLRGINKTAWAAKLVLTAGLAYPVSCASLPGSLTDGKPLPFEFECLLCPAYGSPPTLPLPPLIDSIRVITEVEKTPQKTGACKYVASRISFEILAM